MRQVFAHSDRPPRSSRLLRLIVTASTVMTAFGCADGRGPTGDLTQPSARVSTAIAGPDSAWNHVVIEIAVRRDGAPSARGAPLNQNASATHRARIERWLESDGWETEVGLERSLRTPDDSGTVSRVRFDSQGSMLAAYDARGRTIAIPARAGPQRTLTDITRLIASLAGPAAHDRLAASARTLLSNEASPGVHPSVAASRVAAGARTSIAGAASSARRAWLDQLIVTPASRERTAARLSRQYGVPVERSGAEEHYRVVHGGVVEDEMFDRSTGAVVQQTLSDSRGRHMRVTKEFAPAGNGRYAIRRIRTQYTERDGSLTQLTQDFTTVRVEALPQ